MKPKRHSVIQQVIVLLAVLATFCSWPAVSGSLKGSSEKLIDQRLQTDSLFSTAGSTPSTQTASKPVSSKGDTYSSASVWSPEAENYLSAWQGCSYANDSRDAELNCVLAYMKKSSASEESMNFTRKIGQEVVFGVNGYLETFEEKGRVDIGAVSFPSRANTNGAYILLNGSPSLVSTELFNANARLAGQWGQLDISRDPNYPRLKKQYPELDVWPAGNDFISVDASSDGGQRFIFSYFLVDYCHACGVGWNARVAFDFSRDGAFRGTKVLELVPAENLAGGAKQQFIWPLDNPKLSGNNDYGTIRQKDKKYHAGMDINSSDLPLDKMPVKAIGKGVVYAMFKTRDTGKRCDGETPFDVSNDNHGFGNTVIIQHDDTRYSLYAHLDCVKPGIQVNHEIKQGDKIGIMGNSAYDTRECNKGEACKLSTPKVKDGFGKHLHFEIKKEGILTNPERPTETYFAYTPEHPDKYGYFDPKGIIGQWSKEKNKLTPAISKTISKAQKEAPAGCNKKSKVSMLNIGGAQGALKKYGSGKGCAQ